MATLSTHVLDTARGTPALGINVRLCRFDGEQRIDVGSGTTNADGRLSTPFEALHPGTYALVFEVAPYFERLRVVGFYDEITIRFIVNTDGDHYHVPLLLSPYGYTTYRGS
jgi:5-hydroxyisourate hydrolase